MPDAPVVTEPGSPAPRCGACRVQVDFGVGVAAGVEPCLGVTGAGRWAFGTAEPGGQDPKTQHPLEGPLLGLGMSVAQRINGSQGWGHLHTRVRR